MSGCLQQFVQLADAMHSCILLYSCIFWEMILSVFCFVYLSGGLPGNVVALRAGDLPPGDNLVIGLNPPFGKNNGLATTFVQQAAKFCPRVLVLIVPPEVSIPQGYQVMYEEQDTMKDRHASVTLFATLEFHNVVLIICLCP